MNTPLLLLHGAIGASDQLLPLKEKLSEKYNVHLFDFPGHGGKPLPEQFSIADCAAALESFIRENGWQQVNIFGYSMGGYVALYLAKQQPSVIGKIITLATKFHWDPETAARETKMLDAGKIETKLPDFAAALAKRHYPNDWKTVLSKTADMLLAMGNDNPLKPEDYSSIETPTLVMLGDRDKMVTLEETVLAQKNLPKSSLAVLPGLPHPIEQADASLVALFIERHLSGL